MTDAVRLKLELRETLGKKVARLRRAGIIPVHLYGPGQDSRSLQCELASLVRVLARAGGNTPIIVTVQGETGEQLVFARQIQWSPDRDDLLHVDFLVTQSTSLVAVQVPIVLTGESSGARNSGGAVVQQLHYLEIEALPLEMPHQVEIDLVGLIDPDQVIRAGDIGLSGSSILLTAPDEVVVRIEMPKSELEAVEGEPAVGANDEGGARSTGA